MDIQLAIYCPRIQQECAKLSWNLNGSDRLWCDDAVLFINRNRAVDGAVCNVR